MLALFDGVRLTPAHRRIAQCLLERGPGAAYLSSGEVAELARVSQPSVTRFAMALGYDGYPALRRALRTLDGTWSDGDPGADNELQHAVRGERDGLARLADRLADGSTDRAAVAAAGKLLAATRPLPVLGLREARAAGLSVVVLTDSPVGPAAEAADVALTAPVGSRLVFDLHTGPMALAMVVLQAICDAAPAQTLTRLEEFEVSAARRGVFVA